jgi:phosphate transport system ATP-binding protein
MKEAPEILSAPTGLSVSGLGVRYGAREAVRDVAFEAPAGSITALLGPSGCGKTTVLRSINRLTDLVPGCRVVGSVRDGAGRELTDPGHDLLALRRRVGMVFQEPNPFPQSIRRNFEIPLREHGLGRDEISETMERSLREVGLWNEVSDRLGRSALELSGGQRQRLCLARALALRPEAILLDEPCGALDPISAAVVEDHVAALRGKVTVVLVTHQLAQARRIADHLAVFWMRDGVGSVVESGPAAELFASPRDPDAARYLAGARG